MYNFQDKITPIARKIFQKMEKEYVEVSGSIIPSPFRRWCGPKFRDNSFFLASAEAEASRLVTHFGCNPESRLLDVGCGQGRLPIGLLRVVGNVNYVGIDVDQESIEWCKRYIEREHPSFQFHFLDLYNERYNQRGTKIDEDFHFDVEPQSVDIIYLFSVFSHTTEQDMRVYLKDFLRVLDTGGKIFFTTFVEENVPDISINPKNYEFSKCSGALHVVRYNKDYLFSILDELGYSIDNFTHKTEIDGQSAIYLSRKRKR